MFETVHGFTKAALAAAALTLVRRGGLLRNAPLPAAAEGALETEVLARAHAAAT